MARELGMQAALIDELDLWTKEYADELAKYDVGL
jgi:hypothetical protein